VWLAPSLLPGSVWQATRPLTRGGAPQVRMMKWGGEQEEGDKLGELDPVYVKGVCYFFFRFMYFLVFLVAPLGRRERLTPWVTIGIRFVDLGNL
jgi:hypothetical protein